MPWKALEGPGHPRHEGGNTSSQLRAVRIAQALPEGVTATIQGRTIKDQTGSHITRVTKVDFKVSVDKLTTGHRNSGK
jgi:hypothetical protein